MNEYDRFEAEMQAAGWTLDEIEEMWQEHEFRRELDAEERAHYAGLPSADDVPEAFEETQEYRDECARRNA